MRHHARFLAVATALVLGWVSGCATNDVPEAPVTLADGGSDTGTQPDTTAPTDTDPDTGVPPDGDSGADSGMPDGGGTKDGGKDGGDDGGMGSRDCTSTEDCPDGEVCRADRSGTSVDLKCGPPNQGGKQPGASCQSDADCAANLCLNGACSKPCTRPVQCGSDSGLTCRSADVPTEGAGPESLTVCTERPATECVSDQDCTNPKRCVAQKSGGTLKFVCDSPGGSGTLGEQCGADGDCASKLCVDGHCRLPCMGDGDCSSAEGYTCKTATVDLGGGRSTDAPICVPPTACNNDSPCKVSDVCWVDRSSLQGKAGVCRSANPSGGGLGTGCQKDSNCKANLCYEGRFQTFCSQPCTSNADCSEAGFQCKQTTISDGQGGERPMKLCVKNPPTDCLNRNDCSGGEACAVVVNPQATALERVCIPNPQGNSVGQPCSSGSDCRSNVCINGFCSVPCQTPDHCASGQVCKTHNITKSGLTGSFQTCETLPEEECTASGTCSDRVRICSKVGRTSPGAPVKAYCQFPNNASKGLGDSCTTSSQCRSGLCLNDIGGMNSPFAGECSKACVNDNQCTGTGQICTTLPGTDVGICNSSCVTNGDCDAGQVCQTNENRLSGRPYQLDKICMNRDTSLKSYETQCDPNATARECESGFCLSSYFQRTCTSDFDCPGDLTCEDHPNDSSKHCAVIRCSRLCFNSADCSGGKLSAGSTANYDTCEPNVRVTLSDGSTHRVAACAP